MKVAITTTTFASYDMAPLLYLFERGIHCIQNARGRTLTGEEVISLAKECDGIIAGTEPLTAAVMTFCPQLKAIARVGVGLDSVDVPFATQKGIAVSTTSADFLGRAVAEHTLGVALHMLRHVGQHHREMGEGLWQKHMGTFLRGKKLGIIGFGRMGRAVAALFAVLGCDVAYADPHVSAEEGGRYAKMEQEALLAWADVVTLHCSVEAGQEGVTPLMGEAEFATMRQGTWFINTARGCLVDEAALCAALESKHLSGAALDVFGAEPYAGPLLQVPQALLTPHVASYAREARVHMEMEAAQNMCKALGVE